MPQLDPSVFGTQIFWLILSFILLYVFLAHFILPRIGGTLAARAAHIDDDIAAAKVAKERAEKALVDYDSQIASARSDAIQLGHDIRGAAHSEGELQKQKFDIELAARLDEAEANLVKARTQAVSHLDAVARDLTVDIVAVVSGIKTDSDAAARAISHLS